MTTRAAHRKSGLPSIRPTRRPYSYGGRKLHLGIAGIALALTVALTGCGPASTAEPRHPGGTIATSAQVTPPKSLPTRAKSNATVSQRQAVRAAQNYITIGGFSRAGMIRQLTSDAADGFSHADAAYAADHIGADWNAEAVEAAKAYLQVTGFSRSGLIRQLTSPVGSGFTHAQAVYAVEKVGL